VIVLVLIIGAGLAVWARFSAAQNAPGKLVGQWTRPDGGYVLEIKGVAADGRLDAAYFNPRPIHVAAARASREGSTIKVTIELRDENYPGSTYNLRYDPQSDRLSGDYYQAVARQHYPIFFVRMK
jgi:uncharacterized protein (DUF2147 family)